MFPTDEAIDVVEILRDARRRRREQAQHGGGSGGASGSRREPPMRLGLELRLGLVTLTSITNVNQFMSSLTWFNQPTQLGLLVTQPG